LNITNTVLKNLVQDFDSPITQGLLQLDETKDGEVQLAQKKQ